MTDKLVPAFVVVTAPVLLTYVLAVALLTLTVMSQLPPAGTLPALKASDAAPAAAVTVPLQPAPLIAPAGEPVFTSPPG